ncbi:tetratricopeptide repeat protein [Burkholderia anthina]|uniref:tetratricopeptide repeat protein n=1 Tax=Burkholderia anthina TaxID=179879 RepID=UPI001AA0805D|nr:tetratricopeptide repeat protein [Burkholderia anthina]QTD95272.1 tetratricopeptide repeat protein [Burkholderia anthina]
MTRTAIHVVFATVALCCAGTAAYDWARLRQIERIDRMVAEAGRQGAADISHDRRDDGGVRQVTLARAIALSKAGAYDSARLRYESLIRDARDDETGRAARFDLGNMYLRRGMTDTLSGTMRSADMIDEAKAHYRVLLRETPDDWDARYNLERALRLAPETRSAPAEPDVKSQRNVTVRDPQSKDLP